MCIASPLHKSCVGGYIPKLKVEEDLYMAANFFCKTQNNHVYTARVIVLNILYQQDGRSPLTFAMLPNAGDVELVPMREKSGLKQNAYQV